MEKILSSDISIQPLSEEDKEQIERFDCGINSLDDFFHNELYLTVKHHYFSAFCVKRVTSNELLSIFTLQNDSIIISSNDKEDFIEEACIKISDEYINTFKRQTSFPSINIGHLAVQRKVQNKKIGTYVLQFVIATFKKYRTSGCQFITVDSLNNPQTNKFYSTIGFNNQSNEDCLKETRRMYLPIQLFD